ncbi:MAG: hypothetical protein L6R36_002695 [Xanthoria steineri]|nr:MAG: hypothetical protein L6R36_002695 [Xanthoria steineri]
MAPGWRLLRQVSPNQNHPVLLLKYEFGSSSYNIWLTDLTHVWVEELKQRPLIQRAWDIDSDIDPVESDQRQMLLRHIQDALDEKPGTKIVLSDDEGSNGLLLTAYTPLPKPLQPLQWPIHLNRSSQSTLTNQFLLPLLAEKLFARDQIASLLSSLSHKDHVITKLTDKMQNEGIELGMVFPSTMASKSIRKASSREEVGKMVPGLAAFDERQWSVQFASEQDVPGSCKDLLSQLFARGGTLASTAINEQIDPGAWWEGLSDGVHAMNEEEKDSAQSSIPQPVKYEAQPKTTSSNPPAPSDEHQPSPKEMVLPQRGSSFQDHSPKTMDGDSTTDTSDEDVDSMRTRHKPQEGMEPLGQPSSSSDSHSPKPPSEPRKRTPPKSTPLLGRIGGASKPTISPTKPKLGQVGGMGKTSKGPSDAGPDGSAQPAKRTKSPSLPRETSPERADRKREQLKRELEEKSKVVKKKRKF